MHLKDIEKVAFSHLPSRPKTISGLRSLSPALPTVVYDTFWHFAAERQNVFFHKFEGAKFPWTEDPIIARYRFTNVYRASDRVSQYLIRNVIYKGELSVPEVFFRTILFKLFNKVETWELLESQLGNIVYEDYTFGRYDQVLTEALASKTRIYSAAYIMPSGSHTFSHRVKHRNHLLLLQRMMDDEVPHRMAEAASMKQAFELLRSYPMIGNFLAYQLITDVNYSEICNFSEMEFVMPGPGALDGIRKCFSRLGGFTEADIIRYVTERQDYEFQRLGLEFRSLWGRPLQLIDCQNLFCEVSKYARVKHPSIKGINNRFRIKQIYRPSEKPMFYWFPPKWGLNHLLPKAKRTGTEPAERHPEQRRLIQ